MNNACVLAFPLSLCQRWFNFELRDVDLIINASFSASETFGAWIVTVESGGYASELLVQCGFFIQWLNVDCFVFRTSVPTVERWAMRFHAYESHSPGHRNRYMLTRGQSPEWFYLCLKAYQRKCFVRWGKLTAQRGRRNA